MASSIASTARLEVEVHFEPGGGELARDVARGLSGRPKAIPPKYFYDARGSRLFDQICETDEYYPTRTEQSLLEEHADTLVRALRPTELVELGSGAARKTRVLLDAVARAELTTRYVPFDVSESMLRGSAHDLLESYEWLAVHGIVGDYDLHLDRIPEGSRRLFVFLGGTIGNFEPVQAIEFLGKVKGQMSPHDRLLLGTDLVKDKAVLDAAYNDAKGLTAAFNENVLRVINRELGATFDTSRFEHEAFFNEPDSRIEMHLRSSEKHDVHLGALGMTVPFESGETILTELSHKFTKTSVRSMLSASGLDLVDWYTPENQYFALSLAAPTECP